MIFSGDPDKYFCDLSGVGSGPPVPALGPPMAYVVFCILSEPRISEGPEYKNIDVRGDVLPTPCSITTEVVTFKYSGKQIL